MSDPRRILMTADTIGGVWSYAISLSRALAPSEVVLATMGAPLDAAKWAEARAVENLRVVESRFRLEWMREPWEEVEHAGRWLLELAARTGPDLIHLNQFAHGALRWPAPHVVVGHSDVLSWYRAVRGEEAPPEWDRYRAEVGRGLRAACAVVAPTRTMLDSLARDYGPFARAHAISNGRDPIRFRPRAKRPFVLAAGRVWDDAKNLTALAACAPAISWPLVVAGSCEHPDGGARQLSGVECVGPKGLDEMIALYGEASIYALPARYEPFGLSALEAALSGCALVLGDIPSLRELWDGVASFVPPDDATTLARAIEALIADPGKRARSAEASRARAQGFSPSAMAAGYRALYRSILRSRNDDARKGAACA